MDKLNAYGGTDIQSALKIGLQLVHQNLLKDKTHQPLIIFLTDGEPTVGETSTDKIISTVRIKTLIETIKQYNINCRLLN